ncbi:hypothetical protein BYT27DRAFT_7264845 [Phlegmacium glaucopus]|nr:hypothetical protein BYT27DRAFT_7264845 [Phlegmacium glaucopus]
MSTDNQLQEDFDSRADTLWSIYNKEAECYDRALMETWKDNMDTIVIFMLTLDATKNLKPDPTEQTNALLNQTVVLLAQISQQLGPNGSQTIISPLQPLEQFKLNPSDLHINIFWYTSLGFSITAALGATLVQQWICNYLQVFRQLSGSLERSRMRQYLFHGLSSNHMSLIVECIPAFIHISLFLFFIGLAENLFPTNHAVAMTMSIIISFCTVFYTACSVFPVLYPGPKPFSKLHCLRFSGEWDKSSSLASTVGRLELAMDQSKCKERDTEAIRWMISQITEESEFEPFAAAIGGSLVTQWGKEIWKIICRENPGNIPPIPDNTAIALNTAHTLNIQIESLLHSVLTFSDRRTQFMRAHVCIHVVASLTLGAEFELHISYHLWNTVLALFAAFLCAERRQEAETSFGSAMNLHPLSGNRLGIDTLLEIKWRCLVLVEMNNSLLEVNDEPESLIKSVNKIHRLNAAFYEDKAMTHTVQGVDEELLKAWKAAGQLYTELHDRPEEQWTEDKLNELVPHWRNYIDAMETSLTALDQRVPPSIGAEIVDLNSKLLRETPFEYLADIKCGWPSVMNLPSMWTDINWGETPPPYTRWFMPHLIPPRLLICHLLVCADPKQQPKVNPSPSQIDLVGLHRLLKNPELQRFFDTERADGASGLELQGPQPCANQFWRLEDITEHRGVGFMIEMFFAAFGSLEESWPTDESEQLIKATWEAIIDNQNLKSEYFKTASRGFLSSLWQQLNIRWNCPLVHFGPLLEDLFNESDEDQPREGGTGETGERG